MKRLLLSFCLLISVGTLVAQNIQVHYDFGRALYSEMDGRPVITTTIEHFKPDSWGSTFFFVDLDINKDGVASAYAEIARQISFSSKCPVNFHVEYNGGLFKGGSINNAYLTGLTYNLNAKDFSKGLTFSTLYKYIQRSSSPQSFQLTATWYYHLNNKMFTMNGFADWWREMNAYSNMVFIAEPQFWFNFNSLKSVNDKFNLSVGTEIELTHNFGGRDGFYCIPTLAVKWTL